MTGGIIVIDGDVGDRAGDRMRRGTIIIRGKCGAFAGSRMVGGTIWTELGFGADPGCCCAAARSSARRSSACCRPSPIAESTIW